MKTDEMGGAAAVIIGAALWGIIGFFSRSLNAVGLDSIQVTFIRCFLTAAVLLAVLFVLDRDRLRIDPRDIWMFLGTGILSIVFFNICYFTTLRDLSISMATILLYTAPCMVMVMSVLIFKEKLTRSKVLALVSAFIGCMFVTGIIGGIGDISAIGILLGLGSGFGYALYSIFGKFAGRKYHASTVTVYTFLIAALCLFPFCGFGDIVSLAVSDTSVLINMLALGILVTLIPYFLYTYGLEHMDAGKASVLAFVEPMVATLMGVVYYHEPMTVISAAGIGLILLSVILLNRREHGSASE